MTIWEKNPRLKTAKELHDQLELCNDFKGTFGEQEEAFLKLWHLTFAEIELLEIYVDPDFKKNGMLYDKKYLSDYMFYIYCQVYDEKQKSTHLKYRFDTVLEAVPFLYNYWK